MTTTPQTPISGDQRIFLTIAVDDSLFEYIAESLPYHHKCKPVLSVDDLERRFRVLDWAASLVAGAARAGVDSSQYGIPYSQYICDATNFLRAAEGMSDWLRPKSEKNPTGDNPEKST
jgi:protein involved in sex pheromone biosynthesis